MILITDSGSTKSDWALVKDGAHTESFETMGFNPFFHSREEIAAAIRENEGLSGVSGAISHVYFYGAGCSSAELQSKVGDALKEVFTNAEIRVEHDLAACAYATYEGRPIIACILGTGSNSCLYDGTDIHVAVPALGYILGDEGSGSYYGKKLLSAYLYKRLPEVIQHAFRDRYGLDSSAIFERVYWTPHANVFLASFMDFIHDHREHPYIHDMITAGMKEFMQVHVACFEDYREVPVQFIGSIAYFFGAELHSAARELGIRVGKIVRKPIEGLVDHHTRQLRKSRAE